jgi:lipoprotein-anchoring transpeptidase ErfK/SrfK
MRWVYFAATLFAAAIQTTASASPVHAWEASPTGHQPGTIVVETSARRLHLVLGGGQSISYPVAVGKPGKQWIGATYIEGKFIRPAWSPPAAIKADKPNMPDIVPAGSPANPMGAAALTLSGGEYAIHGTNTPNSIGRFASYGCIRMHNRDILDLYSRVEVGTRVLVLR